MTFLSLFNKLGKQAIHDTRTSKVIAVLDMQYIRELATLKQPTVTIPLTLQFGQGRQRMWLIRQMDKKR